MSNTQETIEEQVDLPLCEWRIAGTQSEEYFCRHTGVRTPMNIVTASVCQICTMREVPCETPRPEETVRAGPPGLLRMGWNISTAVARFVADGFKTVTNDEYQERLAICDTCDQRRGNRCIRCGCRLSSKARGRAFQCPLGKWPAALGHQ